MYICYQIHTIYFASRTSLLERIKRHYDRRFTPPNSDVEPIVNDILNSMDVDDVPFFLREVYEYFYKEFWVTNVFEEHEESHNFWQQIANSSNETLRDGFIKFVKSDWSIFNMFISAFPEKLLNISSDSQFMREFWTEKIWQLFSYGYSNSWEIVRLLIVNEIIPDNEMEDFIKDFAKKATFNPPENMIEILKQTNYFIELKLILFEEKSISSPPNGIDFANRNWNRIKFYITKIGLDDLIVKELNDGYLVAHYGTFYEGISRLFRENDSFKNEYKNIATKNNLIIPDCLK